ncbi:hypothetical protein C5C95_03350 [Rathayibacter sp. AY1B7]|uniref:helicase HerA domain-containing protein n=1 Tax=Rathayibacter sp. AY1B7 TaxID=2080532 RepID=UPI000CE85114|nr:DUF87 domain-containing protein [Rathayibacter sp. AY1B7]PPI01186.1 hypothetical protein C5C95_03350 [Rathayibacter sp. AY1B7]
MNESTDTAAPETFLAPANRRNALRATGFLRGSLADARSLDATRRLVTTVSEWNEGAGLTLTLTSDRKVQLDIECAGTPQPGWQDDVRAVLQHVAEVREVVPAKRPAPRALLRVTARPTRIAIEQEAYASTTTRPSVKHPVAHGGGERELLPLLAAHPGTSVRIHLAAVSPLERSMLDDALHAEWDVLHGDPRSYRGSCVRIVSLLGADEQVPARLRALVRGWGSSVEFEMASTQEWAWDADGLAGAATAESAAISLFRMPVAGEDPIDGVRTLIPPVKPVALDPVPTKPSVPIRLGTARTGDRRRVTAALDVSDLVRHVAVEGATGAGKSTVLAQLCREVADAGYGVTLLDPHGTTVDAVGASLRADTGGRALIVRHGDAENPVPINLFAEPDVARRERAISEFIELVQTIFDPRSEGIVGPRWRTWFALLAEASFVVFGPATSIATLVAIGGDMRRVAHVARVAQKLGSVAGERLAAEYGDLSQKEAIEVTSWAISKLHELVSGHTMRRTLGTGIDAVDVDAVMADGTPLLIDLGSPALGAPTARLLGSIWLLKHWAAMTRRVNRDRPHVVVVDEAQLFRFGALPAMLAEGRKFGVGVVMATQSLDSLPRELSGALASNSGSTLTFRSSLHSAARATARLAGWLASDLTRLPDLAAATVLSRGGVPTEPFTLAVARPRAVANPDALGTLDARSTALLSTPHRDTAVPTPTSVDAFMRPILAKAAARSPRPTASVTPDEWVSSRLRSEAATDQSSLVDPPT